MQPEPQDFTTMSGLASLLIVLSADVARLQREFDAEVDQAA